MDRRSFLGAAVLGSAVALNASAEPRAVVRQRHLKLGLAAYSMRDFLKPRKGEPSMNLEQFINFAGQHDFDAVELTSYYFPSTEPEYLAKLKVQATRLGLDVSGSAVGNDFCLADEAKRAEQIRSVKQWTEHTARLGGKTLRIFAGKVPKGDTLEAARARCIEAIKICCDHAAKFGVILALENHGGITDTPENLLAIVHPCKHEFFGVNLDSGNFRTADPYADLAKIADQAVIAQIKTEIHPEGKPKQEADLARKIAILREAKFRGYVVLEYEAAEDPLKAIPRYSGELRKLLAAS